MDIGAVDAAQVREVIEDGDADAAEAPAVGAVDDEFGDQDLTQIEVVPAQFAAEVADQDGGFGVLDHEFIVVFLGVHAW